MAMSIDEPPSLTPPSHSSARRGSSEVVDSHEFATSRRALLDLMPTLVIELDPAGHIQFLNAAFLGLTGATAEESGGESWVAHFVPPAEEERVRMVLARLVSEKPPSESETPILTRSGERRVIRWAHSVWRNANGAISSTTWLGEDLTERIRAEEALRESERRHRALFASMTDGLAIHEIVEGEGGEPIDFRFLSVNKAFERMTGLREEDILGHSVREVFPDAAAFWLETCRKAVHRAHGSPVEWQLASNGRWFEVSGFPGSTGQIATVLADVTDRRQNQEVLQDRDAELEAIFSSTIGVQLLIMPDGTLRRANLAALEYFGVREDEVLGRQVGNLIGCLHALDSGGCGNGDVCRTCALRESVARCLEEGSAFRRVEVQKTILRHGSPQEASLLVSTTQVRIGGRVMVLIALEDVTTSRQAEERIREQAALLAAAHDAICVLDLEGEIQFWNRGAERVYGWSSEEALGRDASSLIFGGSRAPWLKLRQEVMAAGHWDGEVQQSRRNSQHLTVEARASLVRDAAGQPRSILMVATDVTEKRQLEKQVFRGQRLESLGTLACGIAHDLNNVLTPVQMVSDLLRSSVVGPEGARFLDLLARSAHRGAEIIKQLLLFGRGVEGTRVRMDLRLLVKETSAILAETFPKSIRVTAQIPAKIWPVIGDATQLHQVILNLCVNARDAMPQGGSLTLNLQNVDLGPEDLRLMPEAKTGSYVSVEVSDTGSGIPAEILERIFDPFFTTKSLGQGTGLGLSTVQGIVRAHKGFVRVATRMGAGTSFTVFIPADVDATAEVHVPTVTPAVGGGRQWILVADDEDAIRELVRTSLERSGYRVITAGDGAEAISVFGRRQAEISAVVIDMMMPFIDGAAAIAMLRRLKPNIAILAISGLPDQREEAERASGGRVSFLQKPFQMKDLVQTLTQCLEVSTNPQPPSGPKGGEDLETMA